MNFPNKLSSTYNIDKIINITKAEGGHVGNNHIVQTSSKKYFLKEYKNYLEERVTEIHETSRYLGQLGIPTIPPIYATNNKDYFILNDNYYALFPFIQARNILFNNNDKVCRVLDFDKVRGDSRYREISRSMLFVCTGGKFEKSNYKKIKIFLTSYIEENALDKEMFKIDLKYHLFRSMFSLWVITQYYLVGNKKTKDFMQDEHDTQIYMEKNLDSFINEVISYV